MAACLDLTADDMLVVSRPASAGPLPFPRYRGRFWATILAAHPIPFPTPRRYFYCRKDQKNSVCVISRELLGRMPQLELAV